MSIRSSSTGVKTRRGASTGGTTHSGDAEGDPHFDDEWETHAAYDAPLELGDDRSSSGYRYSIYEGSPSSGDFDTWCGVDGI